MVHILSGKSNSITQKHTPELTKKVYYDAPTGAVAFRGGYQVIGLSGVATAPGQFPATNFLNQSGLSNNNSVLFTVQQSASN